MDNTLTANYEVKLIESYNPRVVGYYSEGVLRLYAFSFALYKKVLSEFLK